MALFWIILAVTVLSFGAECRLAYRAKRWPGIILPAAYAGFAVVFLLLNLLQAFSDVEAFGTFLTAYGGGGLFALVLKIGFLCSPVGIHLLLYGCCRRRYAQKHNPAQHNREYRKMLTDDL